MTPLVTLQVCSGSALSFMQKVKPEKSLPLKSSTWFVGVMTSCAVVFTSAKMRQNKMAVDFMPARIVRPCPQVKRTVKAVFARARKPTRAESRGDIPPVFQNDNRISCKASRGDQSAKHFRAGHRGRCGAVRWGRTAG